VVLKVTPAEPGITDQPVPALLDPLAGQLQVRPVPGLPVQLHHCRLHNRMAIQPAQLAQERVYQVIGEPPRHAEQPVKTGPPQARDPRLDQVTGAMHLMAVSQVAVPRLAMNLDGRVQVPIRLLSLLQQCRRFLGEGGQFLITAPAELSQPTASRLL